MNVTSSFRVELKNATDESIRSVFVDNLRKVIDSDSSFRQPEKLLDYVVYAKGYKEGCLSKTDLKRALFLASAKYDKVKFFDAKKTSREMLSSGHESVLYAQAASSELAVRKLEVGTKGKLDLLVERLKALLMGECPEIGVVPPSFHVFEEMVHIDESRAYTQLLTIFMDSFKKEDDSHLVLLNCLHLVAQFSYRSVYPHGQTMALAGLSYDNVEVNEFAVKCFEDWGDPDGAQKLGAVHFEQEWLEEYARDVVSELKCGVSQ